MTDRPTWEETLEAIESDNPETPRFVLPASRVVVVEVDCPDCEEGNPYRCQAPNHSHSTDPAKCRLKNDKCERCGGRGKVLVAADGWEVISQENAERWELLRCDQPCCNAVREGE